MINIFGSKKKKDTVDFVLNTVKEAGDKLFFTKEEKAENLKQAWDGVCKFVENTLGESSVRSVTRRYLALAIVYVYLGLFVSSAVTVFFNIETAKFLFQLSGELFTMAIMVAGFYFGPYMLTYLFGNKKNK